FFSSRRRHTRSYGDWSSDVCSSDLDSHQAPGLIAQDGRLKIITAANQGEGWVSTTVTFDWTPDEIGGAVQVTFDLLANRLDDSEIGRASCREGGWTSGVGGSGANID